MLRWASPILLAGILSLVSTRASASPSARLVYVRTPSAMACPDESGLREAVRRRVGYDPFFPWAKSTVMVEVRGEGATFMARMLLADETGVTRGMRDLRSGPSGCAGLVDAAALAISIALDMVAASTAPAPEPSASTSTDPAPATPDVPPVPPPAPTVPAPPPPAEPPAPIVGTSSRVQAVLGLDTLAALASAPAIAPGADVWLGARLGRAMLALELRGDAPGTSPFANGGQASIELVSAGLAPCLDMGPIFACALGSLGWLHASGSNVASPRSGSAATASAGARAGVEVPLAGSVALRVHADLEIDVLRPAVSVNGAPWRQPVLSGVAAAGLAYRFP